MAATRVIVVELVGRCFGATLGPDHFATARTERRAIWERASIYAETVASRVSSMAMPSGWHSVRHGRPAGPPRWISPQLSLLAKRDQRKPANGTSVPRK